MSGTVIVAGDNGTRESRPHYFRDLSDIPVELEAPTGLVTDTRNRQLRDLRISVTDRCNFRCVYCMPKEIFGRDVTFLGRDELLTFEEMTRLARIAVAHGVEKIRLTGGEPLLRRGLEELVGMLAAIKTPDGRDVDIALTTNGSALDVKAQSLKDAGLKRVTVSLDSLDDATFKAMNDVDFPVAKVLHGIDVAHEVGLGPIKINMVMKRGQNDQDMVAMAAQGFAIHFALHRVHGCRHHERLEDGRGGAVGGGHQPHQRRAAAGGGRAELQRRDLNEMALPRWERRDRGDLQCHPVVLSFLHPGAGLHGRQAVHVPVCDGRP
jgi:uncharacterized Fe-S cluster-containing radical SAM superfamily enzyme